MKAFLACLISLLLFGCSGTTEIYKKPKVNIAELECPVTMKALHIFKEEGMKQAKTDPRVIFFDFEILETECHTDNFSDTELLIAQTMTTAAILQVVPDGDDRIEMFCIDGAVRNVLQITTQEDGVRFNPVITQPLVMEALTEEECRQKYSTK